MMGPVVLGLLATGSVVVLAYAVYAPATDVWCRYIDRHVIRRGEPHGRAIALTFDDGPDPRYTPEMLDILAAHQVHAAFFLVGKRASRHPDLAQRIATDGHLIGTHTRRHTHAYLMDPVTSWRQVTGGADTVGAAAGVHPKWFRPPWGAFNLSSRLAAAASGQQPVLWSVTGGDWSDRETPDAIAARVTADLHPGAIVVLHDAGGAPGAPENTLKALPLIIAWAKERNYQWVRLDDMMGTPAGGGDAQS